MLLDACDDNGIDCNCPVTIPFFDFDELVFLSSDLEIAPSEKFEIKVRTGEVEFLANVCERKHFSFSFTPQLMACSCLDDGHEGMKFPFESISLTSNGNWSEELSVGADLSDLLLFDVTPDNTQSAASVIGESYFIFPEQESYFYISDRPSADKEHILTLVLTKSNGESVTLEMPSVNWE